MKELLFLFFSCVRIAEHFDKGSFKYFILFFYQAKFLVGFGQFLLEGDDFSRMHKNVLCSSDDHGSPCPSPKKPSGLRRSGLRPRREKPLRS